MSTTSKHNSEQNLPTLSHDMLYYFGSKISANQCALHTQTAAPVYMEVIWVIRIL